MSLDTIIHAGLKHDARPATALVLMGGGARTAYQVGVLRATAAMLERHPQASKAFPFQLLIGTSAGAINATCLAAWATKGLSSNWHSFGVSCGLPMSNGSMCRPGCALTGSQWP